MFRFFFKILTSLKEVISEEILYDPNNASVVLCDAALETALDVKSLHLTQIR
jgi:chromatin remodeling complex protein RSC6